MISATKTIHDAVRENNVKELELIVSRGASVNEVDAHTDDKFTPLHWAAYTGSLEVRINVDDERKMKFFFVVVVVSVCIGFSGRKLIWMLKRRKVGHRRILHRFADMKHVFK